MVGAALRPACSEHLAAQASRSGVVGVSEVPSHAALAALRRATFNLDLASYAHPSWVGPLAQLPDAALWRTSPAVSRWIAVEAGVDQLFDWRMKECDKRFFLMEATEVREAALALGAGMFAKGLARQVRRDCVLAQREAFGEGLLEFTFSQAPHYRLPAVAPVSEADACDPKQLRAAAYRLGAQTLWHMLHCDWPAVRCRAALLFDKGWALAEQAEPFEPGWQKVVRAFLINGVVSKRLPQCAWLF